MLTRFEQEQLDAREQAGEQLPFAFQRSAVRTVAEGAEIVTETNDNDDDGFPDGEIEQWTFAYPDLQMALKHAGRCRVGISGVIVTVTLDGEELR